MPVLTAPGTASKLKKAKRRDRSDSKSVLFPSVAAYCEPVAGSGLPRFCAPLCNADAGGPPKPPSSLQLWWRRFNKDQATRTLTLLSLCIFAVATCQNIIAPNLTAVARAYNITSEVEKDSKMGGQLATAFFVFSMPAFLTIGYYTDRWDRRRLLLLVVASNACATLLTSLTTQFLHLFALRTVSGATVMSILPIAYSVLGDLFPPKTRGSMSTWLVIAMGAGVMLGQLMSGLLGPTVGWQSTFLIASIPGFIMSIVHQYLEMLSVVKWMQLRHGGVPS